MCRAEPDTRTPAWLSTAGEMELPPEETVEEAEAPAPQRAAEAPVPERTRNPTASASVREQPAIVETDLSYIDRSPPFFTKDPDSGG